MKPIGVVATALQRVADGDNLKTYAEALGQPLAALDEDLRQTLSNISKTNQCKSVDVHGFALTYSDNLYNTRLPVATRFAQFN